MLLLQLLLSTGCPRQGMLHLVEHNLLLCWRRMCVGFHFVNVSLDGRR